MIASKKQVAALFKNFKSQSVPATEPEPRAISARLENTVPGQCPYCHQPMRITEACGQEVYYCDSDRAVVPRPNFELTR